MKQADPLDRTGLKRQRLSQAPPALQTPHGAC